MKVSIAQGIVVSKYANPKTGATSIVVAERVGKESSQVQLSSRDLDLMDIPDLVPLSIEAELQGREYKGSRFFECKSISVKSLEPAGAK